MRAMICNFTLDCPDPGALASFYADLLGLRLDGPVEDDWAVLCAKEDRTPKLAFCGVQNYRPPRWPDPEREYPQQTHLDLIVDDLPAAEQLVLKLGGSKLATKGAPIPASQRVNKDVYPINIYADPVGHPFCMMEDSSPWWRSEALGNFAGSSGR
jgi:Glyoxalase-like domain